MKQPVTQYYRTDQQGKRSVKTLCTVVYNEDTLHFERYVDDKLERIYPLNVQVFPLVRSDMQEPTRRMAMFAEAKRRELARDKEKIYS